MVGGEEDGIKTEGAPAEKLYTTPEDMLEVALPAGGRSRAQDFFLPPISAMSTEAQTWTCQTQTDDPQGRPGGGGKGIRQGQSVLPRVPRWLRFPCLKRSTRPSTTAS